MRKIIYILLFVIGLCSISLKAEILSITEGKESSKIKMIVYESLTCGHCADFHKNVYPQLKDNFIDKGLLEIEFRNFPLDMAALNASKIAHCNNDGNSEILHYLFEKQNKWVRGGTIEDLNKNLKKIIKDSRFSLNFDECLNDKKVEDHILEERIEGAKTFKVQATPTLIISGEKFEKPLTYKNLKKYLEKLI
tara:strand:+ start:214 stop:792 length:579 start_codon:yes stop_codon:yes gene_type:complete